MPVLNIFEALNDDTLSDDDKALVMLKSLYITFSSIPREHIQEAAEKAMWFLDGGDIPKITSDGIQTFDWKHDESIVFPAVNKVAGYETRSCKYLHWWTFVGLFNEVGDGLFSSVMSIRTKLKKGKKLEDSEKEFYKTHKNMINLYTKKEQEEIAETEAALKELFGE